MDEQRFREILKEELAEALKQLQPRVVQVVSSEALVDADAFELERFKARMTASRTPENPWG